MHPSLTDKTAKSPFGSFGSAIHPHFESIASMKASTICVQEEGELPDITDVELEATGGDLTAQVLAGSDTMATATITSSLPGAKHADPKAVLLLLREQLATINAGSLDPAEAMAFMQAKLLEQVFHDLVIRAYTVRNSPRFDYLIRLAFRAQAQSARTLETLAVLKKPPVFAQQVNMANQQVVSNQVPVAKNPEAKSKARKRSAKPAKGSPKKTVRLAQKTKSPPPSDATK